MTSSPTSQNRLASETSPYLLQHKDNPVHWWAWGPEALAEAKESNRPILLSVGYAACHWCHVMAHESFEDEATAALMNELFVNIKVDREERPDIDAIYMRALHSAGRAGRLAAHDVPGREGRAVLGRHLFSAGAALRAARLPAGAARGRPRIYAEERDKVTHNAGMLVDALTAREEGKATPVIEDGVLADLTGRMVSAVDPIHGGLSGAPKFPQWSFFWLLWRGAVRYGNEAAKQAVDNTLTHICQGGIYDHLGGGFARYSVDERWLVPHFEKMLYDNALLIDLMCEAYRETGKELYARRVDETVELAAARDDCGRWRIRRLARCRLRGRGGQVLRLEPVRDRRAAGRGRRTSVRRRLRRHRGRQLGRPHHPQPPAQSAAGLADRGEGAGAHARSSCWHGVPIACARAGTTRCWPIGTA